MVLGDAMMKQIYAMKLLVVDDNLELLQMIQNILIQAGFQNIVTASNCQQARQIFTRQQLDGAVLDIMLPDGDGFSLLQELHAQRNIPVLFLSAKDQDADRLQGLGLGADDYITKPFLPRELILRLTAVLRRTYCNTLQEPQQEHTAQLGQTTIHWGSGTVTTPHGQQTLTAKEFALLKKLWENNGNIVTTDSLCQAVWHDDAFGYENTLMVHIRRLREKIEPEPSHPQYLLTVRGLGYKLVRKEPS